MNIKVASGSFSYEGSAHDAHEFTVHTRRAFEESDLVIPNYINDFLFAIEVELQKVGYLTDNFDVNSEDLNPLLERPWQYDLRSGDEFTFENKVYVVLEIKWTVDNAEILAKHIDNGTKTIHCHINEIS
jgi:hypothetical protein